MALCVQEVHTELLPADAQVSAQAPPPLQVRAGLSDGRVQVLSRTDEDLAWMMKKLVDCFPDDRDTLSNQLLSRLLRVRAAEQSPDPEFKIQEINKLLTAIIHLPLKFSQSEPVRMFFGLDSDLDPDLAEDLDQLDQRCPQPNPEQPSDQSPDRGPYQSPDRTLVPEPVSLRDVSRCNGFCLANTETILFDQSERSGEGVGQSQRGEHGRPSICTSCLGHAPRHRLSLLIGRVMRGRSLKMKMQKSGTNQDRYDTC